MNQKNGKWNFDFVEKTFTTDGQKSKVKMNSATNIFRQAKS